MPPAGWGWRRSPAMRAGVAPHPPRAPPAARGRVGHGPAEAWSLRSSSVTGSSRCPRRGRWVVGVTIPLARVHGRGTGRRRRLGRGAGPRHRPRATLGRCPMSAIPLPPPAGTPSRSCSPSATSGLPGRPSSGSASPPGGPRSTTSTARASGAAWRRSPIPACASSTSPRPAAAPPPLRMGRRRRQRSSPSSGSDSPPTSSRLPPRDPHYFTPAPLPMSIAGEVLAQWPTRIDVWPAGRGAFVEEEVVRWLCDLVGYGRP